MVAQEVAVIPLILLALAGPVHDHNVDVARPAGAEVRGFSVALAEYYVVPQREVIVARQRGIALDEVPVILYLAKQAAVPRSQVIDLRLRGLRFSDITTHLGLSPEIYYVPLTAKATGSPYREAYGHFKHKARGKVVLDDDDVVNLVNLRFISHHYTVPPDEVVAMRSRGKTFLQINDDVRKGRSKGKI